MAICVYDWESVLHVQMIDGKSEKNFLQELKLQGNINTPTLHCSVHHFPS